MDLFFRPNDIAKRGKGLTFDDVLLVPRHSQITSRKTPSLRTKVTKNYEIDIPCISANMDTITEAPMAIAMARLGGLGILHRFISIRDQVDQLKEVRKILESEGLETPLAASIGVKEEGKEKAQALVNEGAKILTIDIAHGDSQMMFDTLSYIKDTFPNVDVIAGNTATPDGVRGLVERGADAVKVGIGPGSMCTTRIITGCGMPQLTAVSICAEEGKRLGVPVIADGGIKTSGDIVKALTVGAQSVMLGSLLSGTLETPGEIKGGKKQYRGMASKSAQVSWRGELPQGMAAEGESTMISIKGSVSHVINELTGGLRSGMTYLNALNLEQLNENAQFVEMSGEGLRESRPHGVN